MTLVKQGQPTRPHTSYTQHHGQFLCVKLHGHTHINTYRTHHDDDDQTQHAIADCIIDKATTATSLLLATGTKNRTRFNSLTGLQNPHTSLHLHNQPGTKATAPSTTSSPTSDLHTPRWNLLTSHPSATTSRSSGYNQQTTTTEPPHALRRSKNSGHHPTFPSQDGTTRYGTTTSPPYDRSHHCRHHLGHADPSNDP